MMIWTPRTLADDMATEAPPMAPMQTMGLQTMALGDPPEPPPASPEERVPCACGRMCWPIEMVDVRGLPEDLTGGAEYRCGGCRSDWVRTGRITRAELLEALGAPTEMVQRALEIPYVP